MHLRLMRMCKQHKLALLSGIFMAVLYETIPISEVLAPYNVHMHGCGPRGRISAARMCADDETLRPDGARQTFSLAARDGYLESLEEIPEPHEFAARVGLSHGDHAHDHEVHIEEHQHSADGSHGRTGAKRG